MGVVKADKGIVEFVNDNGQSVKPGFSAVFQDCRLIEHLSPVINVKMVLKKNKKNSAKDVAFAVKGELLKLLDKEALDKPFGKYLCCFGCFVVVWKKIFSISYNFYLNHITVA